VWSGSEPAGFALLFANLNRVGGFAMNTLSFAFIFTLCALMSIEAQTSKQSEVTGYIYYRERIALPANAIVHVQLLDITRTNAPALLIAEQKISTGQQIPFNFELRYDPKKIDPKRIYAVHATISVEEQMWFANGIEHRVLTQGKPNSLDIRVERIMSLGSYRRVEGSLQMSDSNANFVVYYEGKQPAYLMEQAGSIDKSVILNEYVFNSGVLTYYHQHRTSISENSSDTEESVIRMLFDKKGTLIFAQKMVNSEPAALSSTEPEGVKNHLRELLKTVKPPPMPVEVTKETSKPAKK
jgi:putative lipoprotein